MKIVNLISITDAGITKIFKRAGYVYELRAPYVKYLIQLVYLMSQRVHIHAVVKTGI